MTTTPEAPLTEAEIAVVVADMRRGAVHTGPIVQRIATSLAANAKLLAQVGVLVEAVQANWMSVGYPSDWTPTHYHCLYCDASSVSLESTAIRHDDDCPAFNLPASAAAYIAVNTKGK